MIGFDLEHISRVKDEERLLKKIATTDEIAYIEKFKNRKEKVVSLWAAKEAVFKCLNVESGSFSFKDIELKHLENGAPIIILHGKAKELTKGQRVEISLSHTKDIVGAVAVLVKD